MHAGSSQGCTTCTRTCLLTMTIVQLHDLPDILPVPAVKFALQVPPPRTAL